MTYERIELGDRLTIYCFGAPDREETYQWLALVQNLVMDEDIMWQLDRLRSKVHAMSDGEWEAFFHRVREEVGNMIRATRTCMWSAAQSGSANAEVSASGLCEERASSEKKKEAAGRSVADASNNSLVRFYKDPDHQENDFPESELS